MKVEFDIPDELLQQTVKEHVMRAIQSMVSIQVQKEIGRYRGAIDNAVDQHLAKRLTNEDIKKQIEDAVAQRVREALDD